MAKDKTNEHAKYQVPDQIKNKVREFMNDFLKEHDKVKVKVLSIDERGKIGLSIKQLTPPAPAAPQPKPQRPQNENRERRVGVRTQNARPVSPLTFEDKLSKFLKDSDDRMLDLKRNTESKRGGRGARRER